MGAFDWLVNSNDLWPHTQPTPVLSQEDQAAMSPETFANPVVKHFIDSVASIPRKAIENSQFAMDTGIYDPKPTLDASMLAMTGGIGGAGIDLGKILGSGPVRKGYGNVPDSLMGFRKNGPNKTFENQLYKHEQDVKVTYPDDSFTDTVKGLNKEHALERARRNWQGADISPIENK